MRHMDNVKETVTPAFQKYGVVNVGGRDRLDQARDITVTLDMEH